MREVDLPSPGGISQSARLRLLVAQAISTCEVAAELTSGRSDSGKQLREFFEAAVAHCPADPIEDGPQEELDFGA